MTDFNKQLAARKDAGNYRSLMQPTGLVDFASNDYLGFGHSKEFGAQINKRIEAEGILTGSGAARLINGNYPALEKLEAKIAGFHSSEAALLFNAGYLANLALLSSVAQRGDTIFYDEDIHSSMRDGIRLSFAKSYSFKHNDLEDLKSKLRVANGDVYVAVEALYSMDGSFAPLAELCSLAKEKSLNIIVDEAHSVGLYGSKGEGKVVEEGLENEVFARVVTYGKAFGVQGAAVLGKANLKDYMINFSRPFIYSTAMSPYQCLMIDEAYNFVAKADFERKALFGNIRQFNSEQESLSPIQVHFVQGNANARSKAETIQLAGFDMRAILSPTVPEGKERLRICLHSFNTEADILKLKNLLQ